MDTFIESYNPFPALSSFESDGNGGYLKPEVMLASQNRKKRTGRTKFKETRHPVYRGVRSRNSGKWVCEVRHPVNQSRVWLGTHPTADMAARAHDVAVLAMRGRSACLNFADSVWRLPVPKSNDVRDIQMAAAEAAEAFRPSETLPENECYVDEEELYGLQGFLDSMAEALMVTPIQTVGHGNYFDDMDFFVDMSLWNN